MAIKIFKTREDLKKELRKRGLIFNDNELDRALINYNYFNLFNGFETLLLESKNPKKFDKVKLEDFIALYEFDKSFTSELSKCLSNIEEKLKACISHHFTAKYCSTINNTMQYTNKDNYMNPKENNATSSNYCRYHANYPFTKEQNKRIYNDFILFSLFDSNFLTKLIDKNDYIEVSFYTSPSYSAPSNVAKYKNYPNVAVPFWVAIGTLTFGEIIRLTHYLKDDVLEEVLKDFGFQLSKRAEFLNMLDFLLCLRNSCAHGFLVNRFRTPNKYKINSSLKTAFYLKPKNTGSPSSVLSLFDVIKIVSYFEDISVLKILLNKILLRNLISMGFKRGNKLNQKLLSRMGEKKYFKWRTIFSKNVKYIL